jgi:hypothetical protein
MALIILNTLCMAIDSHNQPVFEAKWLSAMQPCPRDGPMPQVTASAQQCACSHVFQRCHWLHPTGASHRNAPFSALRACRCATALRAESTAAGSCVTMVFW